jgi:hypothetical protein
VANGAGLRVSEFVAVKVSHSGSKRSLIRIDDGGGPKEWYMMPSPHLLELFRA